MPASKHRVNVYMEQEHWALLQALRRRTGAPISEIFRRAVVEHATRHLSKDEIEEALKEGGKPKSGKTQKQQRDL